LPLYEFTCLNCKKNYDELSSYDPKGKYPKVSCPECKSKKKLKKTSIVTLVGTQSRRDLFSNKAGRLMDKAKGERRAAEAASHMGTSPYRSIDDTPLDMGIHDNSARVALT
jgi:DNA-directed RNA polymerase subunit RPC12/RpoP